MRLVLSVLGILVGTAAYGGNTVTHQSPCPGYFKVLDICLNYDFPAAVAIGEGEVPFDIEFYTPESAKTGEREYLDIDGELSGTLILVDGGSSDSEFPVKLIRTSVGKYQVRGAEFIKHGMWSLRVDVKKPGEQVRRASLFAYIYPDT